MLIIDFDVDRMEQIHNALKGEQAYIDDIIILSKDPDNDKKGLLIIGGDINKNKVYLTLK